MILSAGCAGVVAVAGPFTWGVVFRSGGVSARLGRLLGVLGRVDLSGVWGALARWRVGLLIGRFGPVARYLAFWRAQVMRLPTKKRWCFL